MTIQLPKLLQVEDHECGYVVRQQICLYYEVTPKPINLADPLFGTDPLTLQSWLQADGFGITSGKAKIKDLAYYTDNGWPVATLTNLYGGHWVTVFKVWRHFVYFYDPVEGERRLSFQQWQLIWRDADRFGREYSNYIIVARP